MARVPHPDRRCLALNFVRSFFLSGLASATGLRPQGGKLFHYPISYSYFLLRKESNGF
jgi:hypothetical protein